MKKGMKVSGYGYEEKVCSWRLGMNSEEENEENGGGVLLEENEEI